MEKIGIAAAFDRHFELAIADSAEMREQSYRVRYAVYCKEFGFLEAARFPNHMELDEYEECSQHCLMIHRATSTPIGCLRLIAAHDDCDQRALPFEAFCPPDDGAPTNPRQLIRGCFGEMSRLAVIEDFRRRRSDEEKPISLPEQSDADEQERRLSFPLIPVGLFLAGIAMFLRSEKQFVFAMMEPKLSRLLQRFGILFTQAGDVVDYHGPRAPFVIRRESAASSLSREVADLLNLIDAQLFGAAGAPAGVQGV